MGRDIGRLAAKAILAALLTVSIAAAGPAGAQTSTPPAKAPQHSPPAANPSPANPSATPPPLPGAKAPPAVVTPDSPSSPKAGATEPGKPPSPPDNPAEPKPSSDASSAKTLTLEARPVATLKGESDWEEGFKTITGSLQTIQDALAKAKIKQIGHPLTVFRETNDTGFKFETMIPVDPATDLETKLDASVAVGQSPAGKALKFQHRGAYEEIDSTYEAITAYLDEKGFDTKNLFIEEYLNSVKSADDTSFQVDIYVLVK